VKSDRTFAWLAGRKILMVVEAEAARMAFFFLVGFVIVRSFGYEGS
jgi:hypothetical protein